MINSLIPRVCNIVKVYYNKGIVNYNRFFDELIDVENTEKSKKIAKAFCLKRLVSKKKRRFENEIFDLDLAYITKRVIAMGYPATTCEKIYRNSISEISRFFSHYHKDNVKVTIF